ncbi:amino acid adenylation domain-containing protein [Plectonema cf. radiosum LEGE 06105]|uniref:Amino acid adenylation domain-containing protein n=1 Tax=Plectonema cf. radiosum LEGE 06105 TaxID=945769 RepID=A0A8J7FBH9_9CYAN|nr:non-ribosomal peptide synthetase [Plectonema radiosum]MBE9215239.1 amino acid adenylation domain-containing protein [Plectonema cf. radiosum LEGE 06105]
MSNKQVEDIYPLSPMQQGMLFHSLYAPNSGVYIIEVSFEIHGKLDIIAFEQAWQVAIDKYPVLRTAFVWDKVEKPLQVVGRKVKLPIILIDWLSLELSTQNQHLQDLLKNQRKQGFNLSKAPLLRLIVIHKQPHVYQLIWIYHHLLLDGWSVPFILQDVLISYNAISKGEALLNKNLNKSRPYKDYIAWLQQQNLSESETFWRKNLAGFLSPTPLILDKKLKSSIKPNSSNQKQEIQLSSEITSKLQDFAKNHQLTINTLIQAAFALMLSRYSGESDVVFGVTSSGRPTTLVNSEYMVGLFINTLPLRVNVDGKQSLLPWLQQLQKQQIELQQYEYTPLVEIQRWSDIPRSLPLFESIIVFENYPVETTVKSAIKDLKLQNISTTEQNNYPLGLYVVVDSRITLRILYDSCRFDNGTISRILNHLQTLLAGILFDSEQILSELPLLTPAEQQQLLIEWNNTNREYSHICIHQLIETQAEQTPEKIAVEFESLQLTYQQLNQKANQLAHHLKSIGVETQTKIGIYLQRSEKILITLLAILKAGGTYIPLDPAFPQQRLIYMIEDSGVNILITESGTSPLTPLLDKERGIIVINLDTQWELISQQTSSNLPPQTTPENLAYIIYTSGSTGKPKGVQIMHKSLVNCLESMQQQPGITSKDTLLSVTTLSFDIAALELYLPLITGARLIIASKETTTDATLLKQKLDDNQVTIMQATPATWRLLLTAGWLGNQQLKILCGGEALDKHIAAELINRGQELWNLYGPTEATIWSSVTQITGDFINDSVAIGKPINNTQFYVVDDYLQLVPIGVVGELYIGGVGLASGYLNQPQLTAQRFVENWFSIEELGLINRSVSEACRDSDIKCGLGVSPSGATFQERDAEGAEKRKCRESKDSKLYKTGDLVRYLASGNLEYLGRVDNQVKLRGFRIELGEIESVLSQHPLVKQAVVSLYKSQNKNQDDQRLIAYLIAQEEVSITQLRQFLQGKLPGYMIPSDYMMLEEFPLTPNRKVDRKALPLPGQSRPKLENYVLPSSEIEREIAEIWQQVLKIEKIGIHDNFFDLGGHSLLMVKVHSQLREKFSYNISLVEMFRHPTINALVNYFSNKGDDNLQKENFRNEQVIAGKERLKQRLNRRKS